MTRPISSFSLITLDFSLKCQDSSALICRLFIDKIHKLLKQHAVPGKYACGFAFAASDSPENLQDDVGLGVLVVHIFWIYHAFVCIPFCRLLFPDLLFIFSH